MVKVKVKRISDTAKLPTYANEHASGMDFYADEDTVIPAGKSGNVSLGIAVELPENYEIQVRSRSGLAFKNDVALLLVGTVDSDYRGEIKACLHNYGEWDFPISKGDRICQGVVMEVPKVELIEVMSINETQRGAKGFGSTGV